MYFFFFSSSNYPHSFTFMHPTFQSFVGLCLLRLSFDICVDVCFYTTCELYSHQLYHLLPFLPPKSTHNLWTQLPYNNVVYVLRLYSAYSSLFLLLSLCHNVSCVAAAAYAKGAPTLHRFVATNTIDNPNSTTYFGVRRVQNIVETTHTKNY